MNIENTRTVKKGPGNISFVVLLVFLFLQPIAGCSQQSEYPEVDNHVIKKDKGISLRMKASYEKDQIKVHLINDGTKKFYFGQYFTLEKRKNNTWYQTEFTKNIGFDSIGYSLRPGNTFTQKIDYLEIPDGRYRIIKSVSTKSNVSDSGQDFNISAVFNKQ